MNKINNEDKSNILTNNDSKNISFNLFTITNNITITYIHENKNTFKSDSLTKYLNTLSSMNNNDENKNLNNIRNIFNKNNNNKNKICNSISFNYLKSKLNYNKLYLISNPININYFDNKILKENINSNINFKNLEINNSSDLFYSSINKNKFNIKHSNTFRNIKINKIKKNIVYLKLNV